MLFVLNEMDTGMFPANIFKACFLLLYPWSV